MNWFGLHRLSLRSFIFIEASCHCYWCNISPLFENVVYSFLLCGQLQFLFLLTMRKPTNKPTPSPSTAPTRQPTAKPTSDPSNEVSNRGAEEWMNWLGLHHLSLRSFIFIEASCYCYWSNISPLFENRVCSFLVCGQLQFLLTMRKPTNKPTPSPSTAPTRQPTAEPTPGPTIKVS